MKDAILVTLASLADINWTGVTMLAAATITAGATVVMARLTRRIARSNHLTNVIAVRENMPVLNFRLEQGTSLGWIVENVGKGVGMNVLLAHETPDGEIGELRDYNALPPGKSYRLNWIRAPYKFVAQYTDIYERRYTSVCETNVNHIRNGWLHDNWSQRTRKPYWLMVVEGEIVSGGICPPPVNAIPSDVARESTATTQQDTARSWTMPEEVPEDTTDDTQ